MYVKLLLAGVFFTVLTSACTDLEEEVFTQLTQEEFLSTPEEFTAALGAAYGPFTNWASNEAPFSMQEVSSDEFMVATKGPDWFDGGHWQRLHQQLWNINDPTPTNSWTDLFEGVSAANRLLFQFENVSAENQELATSFIAELRGLRAMYYYYLMDFYGNVPLVTSFEDTESANNPDFDAGRREVFNFIESELNEVEAILGEDRTNTPYGRVHFWVIKGLQVKLYINSSTYKTGMPNQGTTADLQAGLDAADLIIDEGPYTLEEDFFANFSINNQNSAETIFAIVYDNVFATGNNLGVMTMPSQVAQQKFGMGTSWNGFSTLTEFYDTYTSDDINPGPLGPGFDHLGQPTDTIVQDVRVGSFLVGPQLSAATGECITDDPFVAPAFDALAPGPGGDTDCIVFTPAHSALGPNGCRQCGARMGKFEFAPVSTPDQPFDYPLLRLADIMLLKAELEGRLNGFDYNTAEGLALVNMIRARAGVDPFDELTADRLLDERGREMFGESYRRQDLLRFPGVNGGLTRFNDWWAYKNDLQEQTPYTDMAGLDFSPPDTSPRDAFRNVYGIPQDQINANPNLTQNPGY